jgi:hypothetical protein
MLFSLPRNVLSSHNENKMDNNSETWGEMRKKGQILKRDENERREWRVAVLGF